MDFERYVYSQSKPKAFAIVFTLTFVLILLVSFLLSFIPDSTRLFGHIRSWGPIVGLIDGAILGSFVLIQHDGGN